MGYDGKPLTDYAAVYLDSINRWVPLKPRKIDPVVILARAKLEKSIKKMHEEFIGDALVETLKVLLKGIRARNMRWYEIPDGTPTGKFAKLWNQLLKFDPDVILWVQGTEMYPFLKSVDPDAGWLESETYEVVLKIRIEDELEESIHYL